MTVTWVTLSPTNFSVVEYDPDSSRGQAFTKKAVGNMEIYRDFGDERREIFIHRVVLTDLSPGTHYREWVLSGSDDMKARSSFWKKNAPF